MIIHDLEHLEMLSQPTSIVGCEGLAHQLSLSLKQGLLSLKLGDTELFSTTLPDAPSTVQLSTGDGCFGVFSSASATGTTNIITVGGSLKDGIAYASSFSASLNL